jgi:hypothetical protein
MQDNQPNLEKRKMAFCVGIRTHVIRGTVVQIPEYNNEISYSESRTDGAVKIIDLKIGVEIVITMRK